MADTFANPPEPQYEWQKPQGARFEIGDVISRAFDMLRRNFLPFAITALIVIGIPALLATAFGATAFIGATGDGEGVGPLAAFGGIGLFFSALTLLVSLIILPAAIIYASLKGWAGEPISMRQSFRLMLSRFFSLLGLGIVVGIGIVLGMILLIVPGVILYVGWFVAIPVLIMERKGVFESLSRAWELARGYKWQVFAVVVIAFIINMLITALFSAPSVALGVSSEAAVSASDLGAGLIIGQVLSTIGDAVAQLISALFIASTYYELRRVKEGVGIGAIASVFD